MIPTPDDPNFTLDVSEKEYYNPPEVEDEDLLDFLEDWDKYVDEDDDED